MRQLFAILAIGALLTTGGYIALSEMPDSQYVLVGCAAAIVFALLANAARRSR